MPRYATLFAALAIPCVLLAQPVDTLWTVPVDYSPEVLPEYFVDACPLPDGGLNVLHTIEYPAPGPDWTRELRLIRIDPDGQPTVLFHGNEEVQKAYGIDVDPWQSTVIARTTGYEAYDGILDNDGHIHCLTPTGQILWSKTLPEPDGEWNTGPPVGCFLDDPSMSSDLVVLWSVEIMAGAYQEHDRRRVYYQRIDANGSTVCTRPLGDEFETVSGVWPAGLDHVYILSNAGWISRLDGNGEVVSQYQHPDEPSSNYHFRDLVTDRERGLILAGRSLGTFEGGFVTRFSATGDHLWTHHPPLIETIEKVIQFADGTILWAGFDDSDFYDRRLVTGQLDGDGNVLWQSTDPSLHRNITVLEPSVDNGFFLGIDNVLFSLQVQPARRAAYPSRFLSQHALSFAPNPFNPSTTVSVSLRLPSTLSVTVYDLLGRPVRVLHDGPAAPGSHRFTFDGRGLASGTYLLRAEAGDQVQVRRITLVK